MNLKSVRPVFGTRAKSLAIYLLAAAFLIGSDSFAAEQLSTAGHSSERGFRYRRDIVDEVPWSIHILQIDRSNTNLELHTTLAKGSTIGLAPLSEHMKFISPDLGKVVAAVNGDFYENQNTSRYQGDPKGLQIMEGELISAPSDWSCFWIDPAEQPHIGIVTSKFEAIWPDGSRTPIGLNQERAKGEAVLYTPRVGKTTRTIGGRELVLEISGSSPWMPIRAGETYICQVREVREDGDTPMHPQRMVLSLPRELMDTVPKVKKNAVVKLSLQTAPSLAGVKTALGGGPALVTGGKAREWNFGLLEIRESMRHPRTAIGWNNKFIYLVEVDGRQGGLSAGMTYAEIADYMVKLGCTEALNLDGGGSATMWVYGQIVNSPSKGFERGMANALVLIQKETNGSEK